MAEKIFDNAMRIAHLKRMKRKMTNAATTATPSPI